MDSVAVSELRGVFERLHNDPRRSLVRFCSVSLEYAAALQTIDAAESLRVIEVAMESVPISVPTSDADVVLRWYQRVSDLAVSLKSNQLFISTQRRILDLMTTHVTDGLLVGGPPEVTDVAAGLIDALIEAGEINEAVSEMLSLVRTASRSNERLAEVVATALAVLPSTRRDDVLSLATLEQMIAALRHPSNPEVARWVIAALLALRIRALDVAGAQPYARRLKVVWDGEPRPIVVELLLGKFAAIASDWQRALESAGRVCEDHRATDRMRYQAMAVRGAALLRLGDVSGATAILQSVIDGLIHDPLAVAGAHEMLAEIAESQEDHGAAYRHMRAARDYERQSGPFHSEFQMLDLRFDHVTAESFEVLEVAEDALRRKVDSLERLVELKSIELEQALVDLRELTVRSSVDPLTGASTRAHLLAVLHDYLGHGERIALLVVDIDRFARINESLGHHVGDKLLRTVAERIREHLGPHDLIARWGDDEFVIVKTGEDEASLVEFATRVRLALCQRLNIGPSDVVPTVSIGVAIAADRSLSPEALLMQADTALEKAKRQRGGRIELYGHSLGEDVNRRFDIERHLRNGLNHEWFELYFQPICSNINGRPYATEALIRLHHPEFGLMMPSAFLDVAEDVGLMPALGVWVAEESLRWLERWNTIHPSFRVAFNISASQLADGFLDEFGGKLSHASVNPRNIVIELTEHALLEASSSTVEGLERLRKRGVRVALDDFGTAYSSFAHLRHFPVDVVKIDREFTAGICTSPEDRAIVSAVVTLSETFDFVVVAEGIETAEQLDQQRVLGCHSAQGFLIGQPRPAQHLESVVSSVAVLEALDIDHARTNFR